MALHDTLMKFQDKVLDEETINEIVATQRASRKGNKKPGKYISTGKSVDGTAMPNQMKMIIASLDALNGQTLEQIGDAASKAGMVTRQPPERIAAYYRKPMIEGGFMEELKAVVITQVEHVPTTA
jgi:hypothetical protein